MRRAIVLFRLVVLALALALAGCGDDDGDSDNNDGSGGGLSGAIGGSSGGGSSNNTGGQTTDPQTCAEIVGCISDTDTGPYSGPCYDSAPQIEQMQASTLYKCAEVTGCSDANCVETNCGTFLGLCATNPSAVNGSNSCMDVDSCLGDATNYSQAQQCMESGTTSAYETYTRAMYCYGYECGFDEDCVNSGTCNAEIQACD
ncbi:MAG: hypothetical protein ACLFVJ_10400 [Persicimonas sp.]